MQARSDRRRRDGKTIVLVPTMGFLHSGHLSLVKEGFKRGNDIVVSIFVNPTQFGPGEDFEAYPRDLERDLDLLRHEGVQAVFAPDRNALYPPGYQSYVALETLPNYLCGKSRPTHFRGVATVVTKLFNLVKPRVAVFGRKDYQQLAIIRQMVKDLNFDIDIVGAPIVREPDGLAMSSRNTYLTPAQRNSARALYRSLQQAQASVRSGETSAARLIEAASALIASYAETVIDYIAVCDPETLAEVETIAQPVLMALAVKVGRPRLIDNMILEP